MVTTTLFFFLTLLFFLYCIFLEAKRKTARTMILIKATILGRAKTSLYNSHLMCHINFICTYNIFINIFQVKGAHNRNICILLYHGIKFLHKEKGTFEFETLEEVKFCLKVWSQILPIFLYVNQISILMLRFKKFYIQNWFFLCSIRFLHKK